VRSKLMSFARCADLIPHHHFGDSNARFSIPYIRHRR
jgi:hypothetical protein